LALGALLARGGQVRNPSAAEECLIISSGGNAAKMSVRIHRDRSKQARSKQGARQRVFVGQQSIA
jgi:hypothetical protein